MKVSADRVLYLSRVISRKLKDNMNLIQRSDDETVRRAVTRVLTELQKRGLVKREGQRYVLKKPVQLARIAGL